MGLGTDILQDPSKGIHFQKRKTLPFIMQTESSECGLACVAMISSFYGKKVCLNSMRLIASTSSKGVNLKQLLNICSKMGMHGRAVRLELNDLNYLQLPCIL